VGALNRFATVPFIFILSISPILLGAVQEADAYGPSDQNQSVPSADVVSTTIIASSPTNQFVGAAGDRSHLFVGLLNGTVLRIDPLTGRVTGSVSLPDANSAAHLLDYNGSLYVGTEWLNGALNTGPFHVYKIEPNTMRIVGQLAMHLRYANGFVMAFGGFLWAGDGQCTLYKIDPNSLEVKGTVLHVAEDEMIFDGRQYWTECSNVVSVLEPGRDLPVPVAWGSLTLPDRPRGLFSIGLRIYASGSLDSSLYALSVSGNSVVFNHVRPHHQNRYLTRDVVLYRGLVFGYETGPGADWGGIPGYVLVYDLDLHFRGATALPGPALSSDASQHTLFRIDGRLYFVTQSSVGYFDPVQFTSLN
jgi:hypothetical protein